MRCWRSRGRTVRADGASYGRLRHAALGVALTTLEGHLVDLSVPGVRGRDAAQGRKTAEAARLRRARLGKCAGGAFSRRA